MNKPEDITDAIRDYLKGRMTQQEKAAFQQKMDADPGLENKVAFAKLMMGGLEAYSKKRTKPRNSKTLVGILIIALLLWSAILYFLLAENKVKNTTNPSPSHRVSDKENVNKQDVATYQGGGSSDEESDRASAVVWTPENEVVIGGQYVGPAKFGSHPLPKFGEKDVFLAKGNLSDGFIWAKSFGSKEGVSSCNDLAVDAFGNIIMTGQLFNNTIIDGVTIVAIGNGNLGALDFYVMKFNAVGDLLWINHNGGDMIPDKQTGVNLGRAVKVDIWGNIIATGDYIGEPVIEGNKLPIGGPNEDAYLVKYSPDGKMDWIKSVTGQYMVSVLDLAIDQMGNIFLVGYFGHHNLGGNIKFGEITLETYGGRDIFLAKYSSDGECLWATHAGSSNSNGNDFGIGIAINAEEGCLISGWFEGEAIFEQNTVASLGGRDAFVANYDREGNLEWVNSGGGKKDDQATCVLTDQEGNYYWAGKFTGIAKIAGEEVSSDGEEDIFILKMDAMGETLWIRQLGGNSKDWNSDGVTKLSINNLGQIVMTGHFSGRMKIGDKWLDSKGREDIFLLFFDKNGNLLENEQLYL